MSGYLGDTPSLARYYCPICEPNLDPTAEILEVRYCGLHGEPSRRGVDDDAVMAQAYMSGSTEAGGEDNRRWCALFHRGASRTEAAND